MPEDDVEAGGTGADDEGPGSDIKRNGDIAPRVTDHLLTTRDLQLDKPGGLRYPRGTKNTLNFSKTIVADKSRTAQLGFRMTF